MEADRITTLQANMLSLMTQPRSKVPLTTQGPEKSCLILHGGGRISNSMADRLCARINLIVLPLGVVTVLFVSSPDPEADPAFPADSYADEDRTGNMSISLL